MDVATITAAKVRKIEAVSQALLNEYVKALRHCTKNRNSIM